MNYPNKQQAGDNAKQVGYIHRAESVVMGDVIYNNEKPCHSATQKEVSTSAQTRSNSDTKTIHIHIQLEPSDKYNYVTLRWFLAN